MSLYLNMISMGSIGRVEKKMDTHRGDLRDIKVAVNDIAAQILSKGRHEGSVLTAYAEDDRSVWKEFRRALVKNGFKSSVIHKHKRVIMQYIEELGTRGILDNHDLGQDDITNSNDMGRIVTGTIAPGPAM